jgi:hypothetical protein
MSVQSCYAESWDDYANLDHAWDGQKTVTNKEFEQVMDALQQKAKKKEAKQKKKRAKKISGGGTSLHNELNPDKIITELESVKPASEELLINLPVTLVVDGQQLEKGYYNVVGERDKDNNKIYLALYQAHYLKAKIEANETEEDYGEDEVNFVKVKDYNDSFVKLIFGSIDFNAYAYIPFIE